MPHRRINTASETKLFFTRLTFFVGPFLFQQGHQILRNPSPTVYSLFQALRQYSAGEKKDEEKLKKGSFPRFSLRFPAYDLTRSPLSERLQLTKRLLHLFLTITSAAGGQPQQRHLTTGKLEYYLKPHTKCLR